MDEIEKTANIIGLNVGAYLSTENVGNIISELMHYAPTPEVTEYNKYNLNEFLTLYKIYRLEKMEVISKNTAQLLRQLFELDLQVASQLGEKLLKQICNSDKSLLKFHNDTVKSDEEIEKENNNLSKEISVLHEKRELIEEQLNKFNLLTPLQIELNPILDSLIKGETYDTYDDRDLENVVKKLQSKQIKHKRC